MESITVQIPISTPSNKIKECIKALYDENIACKVNKDPQTLDAKLIVHIPEEVHEKKSLVRLGIIIGIHLK